MWIKICGLTTAAAVDAALALQVDALGFVFTPSVRCLLPQQAQRLAAGARGRACLVAVTRAPSQQLLDEVLSVFAPDALQGDVEELRRLRLPVTLELLPVVRDAGAPPANLPARLLFEGAHSGSGVLSDWQAARALARRTQLVLAGGLSAVNVAAAIAAVAPFGVDVSSGVEAQAGIKSPQAIESFVRCARSAPGERI